MQSKTKNLVRLILLIASGGLLLSVMAGAGPVKASRRESGPPSTTASSETNTFNLADFGATGDGATDDGPALQSALDAVAAAGGGTLLVPAGRYALLTPVAKNFNGLATAVTIQGVASATTVPPPTAPGHELTRGLGLASELLPRTGEQHVTLRVSGLQSFLIEDIAFVGTPDVETDAFITLFMDEVESATVRHCEFYGLSTQVGGAIVQATRSRLTLEQSVFLGSTANSGVYAPVVQNIEWKGITVTDAVFADYGQRPELFSKTGLGAPFSWINVGNAAAVTNDSPRREVVIRRVFLDEGGFFGISVVPYFYEPESAPVDLFYVTGLYMNVSNLGTSGHYLDQIQGVLVEDSHYGYSLNADSAISLFRVGEAILSRLECVDGASRLRASATTGRLTVINSVYTHLDSLAQVTKVISGASVDADPVLYVRQRFADALGRDPDAAAHFYWSRQLLLCGDNSQCVADRRAELAAYLAASPRPFFSITGRVTDEGGAALPNVNVTLSGSQSVATQTDADGRYRFSNLPTSGDYIVSVSRRHYTFAPASRNFKNPGANQAADFAATLNRHTISGRVTNTNNGGLQGITVTLTGAQAATATTDASGDYSFTNLPAGGAYIVTPSLQSHTFTPASRTFEDLGADQRASFITSLNTHTISGRVTAGAAGLGGVTMTLSGSLSAQATTDASGAYSFGAQTGGAYTVTPAKTGYTFNPASKSFTNLGGNQVADFAAAPVRLVEFGADAYSVNESEVYVRFTVIRTGDLSGAASVTYSATDGTAIQGKDLTTVIGMLHFAAGETTKTVTVYVTRDAYDEEAETVTLLLSDPVGAQFGARRTAILTITNAEPSSTNPIETSEFFVRQHYRDFLGRDPDAAGLGFWSRQLDACGSNAQCIIVRRTDISAAFFLSIEFQETGYLVHRFYKASYARAPRRVEEFLLDARSVSDGVAVGEPGWEQKLEANKSAYARQFVERSQFTARYPVALAPAEFVAALNANTGSSLTAAEEEAAAGEFGAATNTLNTAARARALRRVAENQTFSARATNPAFVLMQYFGYLKRNPDDAPDTNLDGYNYWLTKLNQFNGDWRAAEMVHAYISSIEYRERFGR